MLKLLFSLIGVELIDDTKSRRPRVNRVRGECGRYARRIVIKEYGQVVDYIYTESSVGFIPAGKGVKKRE